MPNRMELLQGGRVAMGSLPIVFTGLAVLFLLAGPASAQQQLIREAKTAGQIGEQPDGYIGFVIDDVPENVKKAADDMNARRKEKYSGVAATRGLAVEAVSELNGRKLIDRAKPGEFTKGEDGKWIKTK